MKPSPTFGANLAAVLDLLDIAYHPDAEALIALHLDRIERSQKSPQLPLLKESAHG
jgi:hypothetical protein